MVNVQNYGNLINEFELPFGSYNYFPTNTLGKGRNILIPHPQLWVELLYTHLPYHTDSIIKTHAERRKRKTQEETTQDKDAGRLLFKYIYLSLYCKGFERVVQGFACERVLETEHKLHILTPLLWPSRCVFLVLLMLGSTPSGLSEGPLGRVWPSLPHLVSSCLEFCWQLLWHPKLNSII